MLLVFQWVLYLALLCLGYNSNDLIKIFYEIDESKFRNITTESILCILENYGIDDGLKFIKLISIFFKKKGFDENITFQQIYEITKKNLIIVGCCINTTEEVHFSKDSHPNLCVLKAIRISTAIPILFTPIKLDNKYYMDGGMINNFPIEIFEDDLDNTLAILLTGEDYYNNDINSFQSFLKWNYKV